MSAQVSLELHHRISQFLFHEASLLDDWKFRDWLAQLDEEIRYTMRTTVNAQTRDRRKGVQPPTTGFLMTPKTSWSGESPVWKRHGLAEEPPSRTRHLISNCQISETDIPNVFAVRVNYLLYRAQKSAMKHSMLERVSTKFAVWKMTTGACWNGISSGSSGNHFP